jgi:acetyltransferase-like isoleucine patch superfamily enzyme
MLSSKAISPSAQVLFVENSQLGPRSSLMLTGTIVHPKATIFAIAGPIVIGANCIIEEAAIIVNRSVVCA